MEEGIKMDAKIEATIAAIVTEIGQSPITIGTLILILVVGILLLVFASAARKWAHKCFKEQEKLTRRFEDQMFLLGKYHQDLSRSSQALAELREIVRRERDSEPSVGVSSSTAEVIREVPAISGSPAEGDSIAFEKKGENDEGGSFEQPIPAENTKITTTEEYRKAMMKEAREAARKADRSVTIASSTKDPYERKRLLTEAIQKRERAFIRLREMEDLYRQRGWWLPKERVEMSEVPDEDFGSLLRRARGEGHGHEENPS
jgi:hypothetical protein